jgi:hypothetical protein
MKLRGRAADKHRTFGTETITNLGRLQHFDYFGVRAGNNRRRRTGRRQKSVPLHDFVARNSCLDEGRYLGQLGNSRGGGNAESTQLPQNFFILVVSSTRPLPRSRF